MKKMENNIVVSEIDKFIGSKIKFKRASLGITQGKLGSILGLTFQQIQKYEKGTSKVCCSKLYEISEFLGVPMYYFLEDLESNKNKELFHDNTEKFTFNNIDTLDIKNTEIVLLIKNFNKIKNKEVRKNILSLIKVASKINIEEEKEEKEEE